ncbi:MAG: DNA polymerase III subunit delta [Candidatus Pacebacteria bacterium]|nr:DNA polymerase III subunit delta [Candidatus Paceibacterota bacterium]
MVFFLYGNDTLRSLRKLKEITEKYRSKYKSGFNLLKTEANEEGFEKLKDRIETISMFSEKKLIIIEDLLSANRMIQEKFQKYLKEKNIFKAEDISVIFFERKSPDKRLKMFKELFKNSFKKQEFSELSTIKVKSFIDEEIEKIGGKIEPLAVENLVIFFGNDLWQIENEIQKLVTFKSGEIITQKDVEELCVSNIDLNIFETIEAIAKKDKKKALKLISNHLEKGENEIRILSMINYQFRNLIKIRNLMDENKNFYQIQKISKLHPFVVKKTLPIARDFSIQELKNIYGKILETDFALKTGKVEPRLGIEMFIAEI